MKSVIGKVIFYALSLVVAILLGIGICGGLSTVWESIDSNEVTEVHPAQVEEMKPIQVTTTVPETVVTPDEFRIAEEDSSEKTLEFKPSSAITFYVKQKPVIEFTTDNHILWYRGDRVITVDRETTLVRALRCYMSKLANIADLSGCHCCESKNGCNENNEAELAE